MPTDTVGIPCEQSKAPACAGVFYDQVQCDTGKDCSPRVHQARLISAITCSTLSVFREKISVSGQSSRKQQTQQDQGGNVLNIRFVMAIIFFIHPFCP